MYTTLCIVDMQTKFPAYEQVTKGVLREIELAKRRGSPIIVLEYYPGGDTLEEITNTLHSYSSRVGFAIKHQNGGGDEMLQVARRLKFFNQRVRVCGVNGCYCVFSTAMDLKESGVRVEMADLATGCSCGSRSHRDMFEQQGIRTV